MSKCILVMSVGRSGSSAVAGMLHHLGVDMGKQFEPADKNNPLGTFEDLAFVNLNRAFITGQATEKDYHDMDRALPLWGIKDPQLCLTAQHLIPHVENPCMVIVRRNPTKIIDSYNRAYLSGIDRAKGWYNSTSQHLEEQINNFDGPKLNVWWEDVLKNPFEEVKRLADFVGVDDDSKIEAAAYHIKKPDREKGWGKVAIGVRIAKHPEPGFFTSWTALLTGGVRKNDTVLLPQVSMPAHTAANAIVRDFLLTDRDSLLLVDDDMAFDGMALERLRSNPDTYDYDIVFGFCTHKTWPPKPVVMKLQDPQPQEPELLLGDSFDLERNFVDGGIEPVDAVGMAFTLIKKRVFEAMLHPKYGARYTWWFDYGRGRESDDISFCRRARELGFTMAVDTNVKINHIGSKYYGWDEYHAWRNSIDIDSEELKPILEHVLESKNGFSAKAAGILSTIKERQDA